MKPVERGRPSVRRWVRADRFRAFSTTILIYTYTYIYIYIYIYIYMYIHT